MAGLQLLMLKDRDEKFDMVFKMFDVQVQHLSRFFSSKSLQVPSEPFFLFQIVASTI